LSLLGLLWLGLLALPWGILFLDRTRIGWALAGGTTVLIALLLWLPRRGWEVRLAIILGLIAGGYRIALSFFVAKTMDRMVATNGRRGGPRPPMGGQRGLAPRDGESMLAQSAPALRWIADIGPCLDVAIDSTASFAVVLSGDGHLDQYDCPSFRRRVRYRLSQPGYRVALGPRGHVYVAMSAPEELRFNPGGPPPEGLGDVHVYDLPPLPRWPFHDRLQVPAPERELQPLAVIPLGASVRCLLVPPDRSCVYFLARRANEAWVGRVSAEAQPDGAPPATAPRQVLVRQDLQSATALALSPDGQWLCAAGLDYFVFLGPQALEVRARHAITAVVSDVAVDDFGRVYVCEEGPAPQFTAYNNKGLLLTQFLERPHSRIYIRLQPRMGRAFLSSTSYLESGLRNMQLLPEFYNHGGVLVLADNQFGPRPRPRFRGEMVLLPPPTLNSVTLAVNTWALAAGPWSPQSIAAGPVPYLLGVAATCAASPPEGDVLITHTGKVYRVLERKGLPSGAFDS
jgi:hypothetical protein